MSQIIENDRKLNEWLKWISIENLSPKFLSYITLGNFAWFHALKIRMLVEVFTLEIILFAFHFYRSTTWPFTLYMPHWPPLEGTVGIVIGTRTLGQNWKHRRNVIRHLRDAALVLGEKCLLMVLGMTGDKAMNTTMHPRNRRYSSIIVMKIWNRARRTEPLRELARLHVSHFSFSMVFHA